jgi:hypothetical protein
MRAAVFQLGDLGIQIDRTFPVCIGHGSRFYWRPNRVRTEMSSIGSCKQVCVPLITDDVYPGASSLFVVPPEKRFADALATNP